MPPDSNSSSPNQQVDESVIVLLNRDYDYPDDPRIALKIAEFFLQ